MNERVRMQYLHAMGITMYVPRFILPRAKVSPPAPLPQISSVAPPRAAPIRSSELGQVERPASRANEPVAVGRLVESLRPEPAKKTTPEPVPEPASRADLTEQRPLDVRFTLQIWQISPEIMVIDSHQPRQGLPTARLLANMLFAIGRGEDLPVPELLAWPLMPQLPAAPLSHARDMVSAFLASRLQAAPAARLWLMGHDAQLACTQDDGGPNEGPREISIPELSVPALLMPSLADLLHRGELKAQVWNLLRCVYRVR